MMKKICIVLLCIVLTFCTMGCNTGTKIKLEEQKEEVEIAFSWWGSDPRHEYTIAAIKKFEEKYPYIKVNLEYSEFTGFQLKTNVEMQAKTEADVMQLNYAWVDLFSPDGTGFYDLDKLKDTVNLSNYSEEQLNYGVSNGVKNALPIALNGKVLLYNKAIYDKYGLELPKTWNDLYHAAEVMNKDGIYPLDMEASAIWFMAVAYVEQLTGKQVITDDNKFNFSQEDVRSMIAFYTELVQKGVVEEVSARKDSKISDGKYAGTVQWVTSTEKYSEFITQSGGTPALGTALTTGSAKRSGWYIKPATMYAVSANTSHPQEAALLLEFLVSSEEMALEQQLDKGVPSNSQARQTLEKNNLLTGIFFEASETVDNTETYLMSPYFENSAFSNSLKSACIDVIYGKSDLDSAAAAAYEAMNKSLN